MIIDIKITLKRWQIFLYFVFLHFLLVCNVNIAVRSVTVSLKVISAGFIV